MTLRALLLSLSVLFTLACGGYDPTLTREENVFGLEDVMSKKVKILSQPDQFERRAFELAAAGKLSAPKAGPPTEFDHAGPWSGNNQLGNQGFLIPDPLGGALNEFNTQEVFKMNEWGFPQMWTLCLQITYPNGDGAMGQLITAQIEFGAGGTTQTIEVDWINGTILTLPMNAVSVRAIFANGFFGDDDVFVSVIAARGTRPGGGHNPPITTLFRDGLLVLNTASSASFPLPRFTKRVRLWSRFSSASADIAAFYNANNIVRIREQSAGTVVAALRFSDLLTIAYNGIEVNGSGSHFIDFTNNSGASIFITATAELPF